MTYLKAIAIALFALLAPVHAVMAAVGALILIDLVVGLLAAKKRGEHISSSCLRRTVTKAVVYQVAIISGFLLQQYLIADFIPVAKLIASTIGIVEVKSILENLDEINGSSLFKSLVKKLGSVNDVKQESEDKKDE